jgi:hypothetical protein
MTIYSYTTIDPPGSTGTFVQSTNDLGQIVGYYRDSSGVYHGFLAVPPSVMMEDVITSKKLSTLSGTAEANSSASIFDGTKYIGRWLT